MQPVENVGGEDLRGESAKILVMDSNSWGKKIYNLNGVKGEIRINNSVGKLENWAIGRNL